MVVNKTADVNELDFDALKQNLISFFSADATFADYNYEGSALNSLMDIFAFNTLYGSIYNSMAINEGFLDTAIKRESVVSASKMNSYVPRSKTASIAYIDVTITPVDTPSSITIAKGTEFTSSISDTTYYFTTADEYIATSNGDGTYTASDVKLIQGRYNDYTYTIPLDQIGQQFLIPNVNVDTNYLTVVVQNSTSDVGYNVFAAYESTSLNLLSPTSTYYFLQETYSGYFAVSFGDNILGKNVQSGNVLILDYIVTDGILANGASSFAVGSIAGYTNIVISTVQVATGGQDKETIESIRYNSPLVRQMQERIVTTNDYKTQLTHKTGFIADNVQSLSVWGGEDNDPPIYGKVFMSLKPKAGITLTNTVKQSLIDSYIKNKNVLCIIPEIVDADYLYLDLQIDYKFNPRIENKTEKQLNALIVSGITAYNDDVLSFFENNIEYSQFVAMIDNINASIISNLTFITLKKKTTPIINTLHNYDVKFYNMITPNTIFSNYFLTNESSYVSGEQYFLRDNGNGLIDLYKKKLDNTEVVLQAEIGTVDYESGHITISSLNVLSVLSDTTLNLSATPLYNNVVGVRNLLLEIDVINLTGVSI